MANTEVGLLEIRHFLQQWKRKSSALLVLCWVSLERERGRERVGEAGICERGGVCVKRATQEVGFFWVLACVNLWEDVMFNPITFLVIKSFLLLFTFFSYLFSLLSGFSL